MGFKLNRHKGQVRGTSEIVIYTIFLRSVIFSCNSLYTQAPGEDGKKFGERETEEF